MKKTFLSIAFLLLVASLSLPASAITLEEPIFVRGDKVVKIITCDLNSHRDSPVSEWKVAVAKELEKDGWVSCFVSAGRVDVEIHITGTIHRGVREGNTAVLALKRGDYVAKCTLDNVEPNFAARVARAVNRVLFEAKWFWLFG